eukprot:Nitzschia sp. Nitz4//scaffold128_size63911//1138//2621//NITZ4_006209-RA/size63911-snap-gene-0.55-mRNA-1//1//CDS//3329534802//1050//frame0
MSTEPTSRRLRKEEGKRKKRQLIEESGGVRPRPEKTQKTEEKSKSSKKGASPKKNSKTDAASSGHRFGRVMEAVPCRDKPRFSTVSIALPGSVLSNCQTKELRTLLVGQIARAATIYHVDEIIVFDDKLGKSDNRNSGWRRHREHKPHTDKHDQPSETKQNETTEGEKERIPRSNTQEFMARLLQYCECPQYLRRHFFPMHPDLQFAGLLAPIDAPHHVRAEDRSRFRDGVVLPNKSRTGASLVNCGIRSRPVEIDRQLAAGIRCTVEIDPVQYGRPGVIKGTVVSPSKPREVDGTYWGYTIRMASSINEVFDGCPYEDGYDLKIGTSERGDTSVTGKEFSLPEYEHSLLVFGGVAGIEECVDADEKIKLPGAQSSKLFDMWLNTCPFQGSRTIRTEEAVMISLSQLSEPLSNASRSTEKEQVESKEDESSEEDESAEEESSEDSSSDAE